MFHSRQCHRNSELALQFALVLVSLTIRLLVYYAPYPKIPPRALTPTPGENTNPENSTTTPLRDRCVLRAQWRGWLILKVVRLQWALKDDQTFPMLEKRGDFPLTFPLQITTRNQYSPFNYKSPDHPKVSFPVEFHSACSLMCSA